MTVALVNPRRWRHGTAFVAAWLAMAVPACTATGPEGHAPDAVEHALAAARAGGAGDEQLQVLLTAEAEGRDITTEEFRAAGQAFVDCLRDGGLREVQITEYEVGPSVEFGIGYTLGEVETESQADEIYLACGNTHYDYVLQAYGSRTEATEWTQAQLERFRPAMIECLRGVGIEVADDATVDEVMAANIEMTKLGLDTDMQSCAERTGLGAVLNGD